MTDRRRNLFILLAVLGLLLASLVVITEKKTRLGLDLRGGVELVYQGKPTPQVPSVTQEALDRAIDIIRERVNGLGVSESEIQRSGRDQISVGLPDVTNAGRAQQQVGKVAQLFFYDWEINVIGPDGRPDPTNRQITDVPLPTFFDAVQRAAKRPPQADGDNTTNFQWFLFGKDRKLLAGPEESTSAERPPPDLFSELAGRRQPPGSQVLKIAPGTVIAKAERPDKLPKNQPYERFFVLDDDPELSGTDIKNPEQNYDQGAGGTGGAIVTFSFTNKGRQQFQKVTRRVAQRGQQQAVPTRPAQDNFQHFAAVLDNETVTRPFISYIENPDGIDGRNGAQISGGFTPESAQDLARLLKTGALPIKLELISQSQVSATLGKQALDQGLLAAIAGFSIVVLFLLIFYRMLGLIASVALVVYAVYFFAIIKLIPITLTLPGIAGLILTIGVAADANIVIFERVKEEIRGGRSIPSGIATGYKKGLSAIIDANVVTIMVAFILFILATAGVKGFAFVLGIGTLASLFTAVLATSAILGTLSRSPLLGRPSALGAGPQKRRWHFDFMGASKWFFSMSGVILLVGALAIGGKGLNFGIDFESGTRIKTGLQRPADEDQVRSVLKGAGFGDAKIQRLDDPELGRNVFQISTATLQPDQVTKVRSELDRRFRVGNNFSNSSIGPTFGQTVARSALIAIIASLIVISAYIALRFEWKYAVPVLIALMHDILITGGVYSLTGREVTTSTVAALLTILGFSLYDTIIVFDRIRENVPRMPRAAFSQIVNRSMAEVLTRSLATSFCTGLPVLALMLFGGETLKDFAFALLVGIASGTYSSIFIASPVLTLWKEREETWRQRLEGVKRRSSGVVPAYASATRGGEPIDVEPPPEGDRRRLRRPGALAPDQPDEVSADEFEEMVRDIATESQPTAPKAKPEPAAPKRSRAPARAGATSSSRGVRARPAEEKPDGRAEAQAALGRPETSESDGEVAAAPDATAEEVDDASATKQQRAKPKRQRAKRHGRRR
ncbi:MAG: protein translocase subunit SecD [Solirubrobacteraceae bacterium]